MFLFKSLKTGKYTIIHIIKKNSTIQAIEVNFVKNYKTFNTVKKRNTQVFFLLFRLQKLHIRLGNSQYIEALGFYVEFNGSPVDVTRSYGYTSPGIGKKQMLS